MLNTRSHRGTETCTQNRAFFRFLVFGEFHVMYLAMFLLIHSCCCSEEVMPGQHWLKSSHCSNQDSRGRVIFLYECWKCEQCWKQIYSLEAFNDKTWTICLQTKSSIGDRNSKYFHCKEINCPPIVLPFLTSHHQPWYLPELLPCLHTEST